MTMEKYRYDIYKVESEHIPVSFKSGVLDKIEGRVKRFSSCRVADNGRLGYYTSSKLTDDELIERAKENASNGKKIDIDFPDPTTIKEVDVYSESIEELDSSEMVSWGEEIIDGIKNAVGVELPIDISIDREVVRYSIKNFKGIEYDHKYTSINIIAIMTDAREGDIHWVFGFDFGCELRDIDRKEVISAVVENYKQGIETTGVESGRMPVLIHPYAINQFIAPLMDGLNGENVLDGTSPLIDRRGDAVLSEKITISDEPFLEGFSTSAPFDMEGTPANRRVLIDRGVLSGFNHTLETAEECGDRPTGGAIRGGNGRAYPGAFNLTIEPGERSYKDILQSIDKGLFLRYMTGAGQANTLAGEYSMGILSGFLIEKGELTRRPKKVMISGNLYEDFLRVAEVSTERRKYSDGNTGFLFPYILVEDMSVYGM